MQVAENQKSQRKLGHKCRSSNESNPFSFSANQLAIFGRPPSAVAPFHLRPARPNLSPWVPVQLLKRVGRVVSVAARTGRRSGTLQASPTVVAAHPGAFRRSSFVAPRVTTPPLPPHYPLDPRVVLRFESGETTCDYPASPKKRSARTAHRILPRKGPHYAAGQCGQSAAPHVRTGAVRVRISAVFVQFSPARLLVRLRPALCLWPSPLSRAAQRSRERGRG